MDEIMTGNGSVVDPRLLQLLNGGRESSGAPSALPVTSSEPPPMNPDWHPVAIRLYQVALACENVHLFEASDWSICVILAESVTRELTVGGAPRIGSMHSWTQVLADLDTTVARRHGLA